MPDISDRRTREAEHASALALIMRRYSRKILSAQSAAIDWEAFRAELKAELKKRAKTVFLLAVLIYLAVERGMRRLVGHNDMRFGEDAEAFAEAQAEQTSQLVIQRSRQRISAIGSQVSRLPTQTQPQAFAQAVKAHFSDSKADAIATDNITRSISAGELTADKEVERRTGLRKVRVWVTARDQRVCPICEPFHRHDETETSGPGAWSVEHPTGPPAHVRCRCFVLFRVIRERSVA